MASSLGSVISNSICDEFTFSLLYDISGGKSIGFGKFCTHPRKIFSNPFTNPQKCSIIILGAVYACRVYMNIFESFRGFLRNLFQKVP
jgi:hypothetical protein